MKTLLLVLFISFAISAYGQNSPIGNYKLIAIQNKNTNSIDSVSKYQELIINFVSDTTISFKLSSNRCLGNYYIENKKINFKSVGCTKMGGDSELDKKFCDILDKIDKISIIKNDIILENLFWTLYLYKIE